MTNEEVMQLMTDMGLHEGGIENWLMDNAWYLVVNKAIEKEREACALICDAVTQDMSLGPLEKYRAAEIAKLIRARGQA